VSVSRPLYNAVFSSPTARQQTRRKQKQNSESPLLKPKPPRDGRGRNTGPPPVSGNRTGLRKGTGNMSGMNRRMSRRVSRSSRHGQKRADAARVFDKVTNKDVTPLRLVAAPSLGVGIDLSSLGTLGGGGAFVGGGTVSGTVGGKMIGGGNATVTSPAADSALALRLRAAMQNGGLSTFIDDDAARFGNGNDMVVEELSSQSDSDDDDGLGEGGVDGKNDKTPVDKAAAARIARAKAAAATASEAVRAVNALLAADEADTAAGDVDDDSTVTIQITETDTMTLLHLPSLRVWGEEEKALQSATQRNDAYAEVVATHKEADRYVGRGAQTLSVTQRTREAQASPPTTRDCGVSATTWRIWDALRVDDADGDDDDVDPFAEAGGNDDGGDDGGDEKDEAHAAVAVDDDDDDGGGGGGGGGGGENDSSMHDVSGGGGGSGRRFGGSNSNDDSGLANSTANGTSSSISGGGIGGGGPGQSSGGGARRSGSTGGDSKGANGDSKGGGGSSSRQQRNDDPHAAAYQQLLRLPSFARAARVVELALVQNRLHAKHLVRKLPGRSCDVYLGSCLCVSLGSASALVTFIRVFCTLRLQISRSLCNFVSTAVPRTRRCTRARSGRR
jgi:hypothetical protein